MAYHNTVYNSLDKENCVNPQTSTCTSYQGPVLLTIPQEAVECRPSIDTIFVAMDVVLDKAAKSIDLQAINGQGMTGVPTSLFTLQTLKVYELFNLILADNKRLRDRVAELQNDNILDTQITIDLSCLNNPNCEARTAYSLGEVLQILIANACG